MDVALQIMDNLLFRLQIDSYQVQPQGTLKVHQVNLSETQQGLKALAKGTKTHNQTSSATKCRVFTKHNVLKRHLCTFLSDMIQSRPQLQRYHTQDGTGGDICIVSSFSGNFYNVDEFGNKFKGSTMVILDTIRQHKDKAKFPKITIFLIELSVNKLYDNICNYLVRNQQELRGLVIEVFIFHCTVETFFDSENTNLNSIGCVAGRLNFDYLWQNHLSATHMACFWFWDPYGTKLTYADYIYNIFNKHTMEWDILVLLMSNVKAMQNDQGYSCDNVVSKWSKTWKHMILI